MPAPLVEPFSDAHLDAAGELLAARHARHREAEPLLAARYEQPSAAREEIEALVGSEGASGVAAIRDGEVVGVPRDDNDWGANIWIEAAGHAADDPELVRDLYAAAAARWVEGGRTRHYALVPAGDDDLVTAWFRVSFGQQHAHGIRELNSEPWPDGARLATPEDIEGIIRIAPLILRHQALSPVFSDRKDEDEEEALRREIEDELANPDVGYLVAEVDGRLVGTFVVAPIDMAGAHTGPARPDRSCFLAFAATDPAVRGSGTGSRSRTHASRGGRSAATRRL